MRSLLNASRARAGLFAVALAIGVTGCDLDTVLEVDRPGVLTEEELTDPADLPVVASAPAAAFTEAFDNYVRYSGLFVDEFIAAGTFPTRVEVDERAILPENATVTDEVAEPLHRAVLTGDTVVSILRSRVGVEDFDQGAVANGIARGLLYGAYARVLIAELYCQSPLATDPFEGGPNQSSDAIMQSALDMFEDAEAAATDAGLASAAAAAQVGQARALLWLGQYAQAATVASTVPTGFEYYVEYSNNDPDEYNEVYRLTYGVIDALRWTVGDGTTVVRHNEAYAYYDEWVALGRIDPSPALTAFNTSVPVRLQLEYDDPGDNILLASAAEADMIQAEAALRAGDFGTANDRVNPYRAEWELADLDFETDATDLQGRLELLAQERARELWMTGTRQGTLRRLLDDGVDLYPTGTQGTQTCWPVPAQERDNNPVL